MVVVVTDGTGAEDMMMMMMMATTTAIGVVAVGVGAVADTGVVAVVDAAAVTR